MLASGLRMQIEIILGRYSIHTCDKKFKQLIYYVHVYNIKEIKLAKLLTFHNHMTSTQCVRNIRKLNIFILFCFLK